MNKNCTGLIIKSQSGFFTVHCEQERIECRLRGQLNHKQLDTDLATIGDKVIIDVFEDGTGIIKEVCERNRVLSRRLPSNSYENKPRHGKFLYLKNFLCDTVNAYHFLKF